MPPEQKKHIPLLPRKSSTCRRAVKCHVRDPPLPLHSFRATLPVTTSCRRGLALPVDRQQAACDGHPDNADSRGHAHIEGTKVQGRQQEAEGAALHRRLNSHRAAGTLVVACELRGEESEDATKKVQCQAPQLQWEARTKDGACALSDGGAHQQHRGNNTDNWREGRHFLAETWCKCIGKHTQEDGSKHHLEGRDHNAHCIHRHHGTKDQLTDKWSHENAAQCCGGCHEDAQSHIAASNQRAEV
mmetsp:Transcript_3763/g.7590  ORF Transcript_3763/g.7590 Transcript_3763/m.7590 type:complete len:244 (+) Transcript_3763:106-837(+)